jgi:superfamily I DNA/RNA helicase
MIALNAWRPENGMKFERNALAAISENAHSIALSAGPGAGKTEVLAQRAHYLLSTGQCWYPQRILAISFKTDAARNLRQRVFDRCGQIDGRRVDSHTFHAFAKSLIDKFRPLLTGRDALDAEYSVGVTRKPGTQIHFDDLVPLAIKILRSSEMARSAVRLTYTHVFLDEFQDCTSQQYSLIQEAFMGSGALLTAVGDDKQRIMGWAGALKGVFKRFIEDFQAQPLTLFYNFRSAPRLRRMQNAMVRIMEPASALDDQELLGEAGQIAIHRYATCLDEAEKIGALVQQWIQEEGVAPSSIGILVSKQLDLYGHPLMERLRLLQVPFRNEQLLQDFASEPIVRLILDFLLVVVGDGQAEAQARIASVLNVTGMDDDSAYRVQQRLRNHVSNVREEARRIGDACTFEQMRRWANDFLTLIGRDTVCMLSHEYRQGGRLRELVKQAYERLQILFFESRTPAQVLAHFVDDDSVKMMTIHKSKGLEFDNVIVLGVENEAFFGDIADERSVFFVAISRAKHRLILTVADYRSHPPGPAKRWDTNRSAQQEFLSYAAPYL